MAKKKLTPAKKVKAVVKKNVVKVVAAVKNNHCTLEEFNEGSIVLEELKNRIFVVFQYQDIMSVSVKGNYCTFKLRGVKDLIVIRITLDKVRALLPANYFWFVHASHIVGRKHFLKLIPDKDGGGVLLLYDGTKVDVSPEHLDEIRTTFEAHGHFLPVKEIKIVRNREEKQKNNI